MFGKTFSQAAAAFDGLIVPTIADNIRAHRLRFISIATDRETGRSPPARVGANLPLCSTYEQGMGCVGSNGRGHYSQRTVLILEEHAGQLVDAGLAQVRKGRDSGRSPQQVMDQRNRIHANVQ